MANSDPHAFTTRDDDDYITSIHYGGVVGTDWAFWIECACGYIGASYETLEGALKDRTRHSRIWCQTSGGMIRQSPTVDDTLTGQCEIAQMADHFDPNTREVYNGHSV